MKCLADVFKPDPWWDAFVFFDGNEFRRRKLDDHYALIDAVQLCDDVPETVRQVFENARDAYLYAFFAHRLLMAAELQVRISVEVALREKAKASRIDVPDWWGMKRLFNEAIKRHWIIDGGFEIFRRNEAARKGEAEMWSQIDPKFRYEPPADARAYCLVLAENFPSLRNELAHGSDALQSSLIGTFEISADLINQLFQAAPS